jgi:hypothetical protein
MAEVVKRKVVDRGVGTEKEEGLKVVMVMAEAVLD